MIWIEYIFNEKENMSVVNKFFIQLDMKYFFSSSDNVTEIENIWVLIFSS